MIKVELTIIKDNLDTDELMDIAEEKIEKLIKELAKDGIFVSYELAEGE